MAIRKVGEKHKPKTAVLRVTIPKRLLDEFRDTKKRLSALGYTFDIKPDVAEAVERALEEGRRILAKEEGEARMVKGRPKRGDMRGGGISKTSSEKARG